MNQFSKIVLIALLISSAATSTQAQGLGNAPYSTFGVGEVFPRGFAQFYGMGGSGVSVANGIYTNTMNPALLAANHFTTFEVGLLGHYKRLQDVKESQKDFGANLHYLNLTFPLGKIGAASFGIQPYSTVDYESRFTKKAQGSNGLQDVVYSYKGVGAVNKATLAAGFNPVKPWYIGLATDIYFGNILAQTNSRLKDQAEFLLKFNNKTSLNGTGLRLGTAWKQKINKDWNVNFGATYELKTRLNTTNLQTSQAFQLASDGSFLPVAAIDTLGQSTGGKTFLPPQYRFGFSVDSPYKFVFSADYSVAQWSKYSKNGNAEPVFRDANTIALGLDYTPGANSTSFFKKTSYRFGFASTNTQYFIANQQVKDNSVSLGFMFPVGRSLSYTNLSLVAGRRGNLATIKEDYIKIALGFTLTDLWFRKVKID